MATNDMNGKVVIVTGASAGIGKMTALEIARRGARVIMACRDLAKSEPIRDHITKETGNEDVVVKLLDLASLKSVREFADDINQNETRIDILINNAGLISNERQETEDGFELTMGVNHLGHFLLTNMLLEKVKASAPSRIVNVSSGAHAWKGEIDFDNIMLEKGYASGRAYASSKSANIMFTVKLAEMLQGTGVTTYSLHPGIVKTEFGRNFGACTRCCFGTIMRLCCLCVKNEREGAETTLYCALDPGLAEESGLYYSDCKRQTPKPHTQDETRVDRLWKLSAELTGWSEQS